MNKQDAYWDGPEGMLDLCAGLALLTSYEPDRFMRAMQDRDAEECEHLTAVAIALLVGQKQDESLASNLADRWSRLLKQREDK